MKNKQNLTLELKMKIDNEALVELRKIRAAMDDAYDKLNKPLYEKNIATKVSYKETIPFNLIQENFEFIATKIKELEDLGALVGGDFQILDSLLMNPASVVALKAGKTAMVAQIDQLERQMQSKLASNEQPQAEGMYLSPIVITKRSEWDDVPIGSFVQLPDGRLVYKEK